MGGDIVYTKQSVDANWDTLDHLLQIFGTDVTSIVALYISVPAHSKGTVTGRYYVKRKGVQVRVKIGVEEVLANPDGEISTIPTVGYLQGLIMEGKAEQLSKLLTAF